MKSTPAAIFGADSTIHNLGESFADALFDFSYGHFRQIEGRTNLSRGLTLQQRLEDSQHPRAMRRPQFRHGSAVMGIHPLFFPQLGMINGGLGRGRAVGGGAKSSLPGDDALHRVMRGGGQVRAKATFVAIVAKIVKTLGQTQQNHLPGILGIRELQAAAHAVAQKQFTIATIKFMPGPVITLVAKAEQQ